MATILKNGLIRASSNEKGSFSGFFEKPTLKKYTYGFPAKNILKEFAGKIL